MKRSAISFACFTLAALFISAARHPIIGSAGSSEIRHFAIAGGSIARAFAIGEPTPHDPSYSAALRRIAEHGRGTYIEQVLAERDSAVIHWPDRQGVPLTVWVQPRSGVRDFLPEYVVRVRDAFLEWDAVHLPLGFTFVRDSAAADVHVTWIDHFDEPISGRTRWAHDDEYSITDANIVLAVHHSQGDQLEEDAMQAMALHEIGHLIGLDHTNDTLAVMAPRVRVRGLSDADRATARLLYALPTGSLR